MRGLTSGLCWLAFCLFSLSLLLLFPPRLFPSRPSLLLRSAFQRSHTAGSSLSLDSPKSTRT
jgi:hypothetical protein